MTGQNARHNVLAASGNYAMYTAGADIFSSTGEILVQPGRLVVYDPLTLKGLGAGITATTNPEIVIGVAVDLDGDGVSDAIRANFGDKLYGYHVTAVSSEPPACGTSPIKDFFFDGCTSMGDTFVIAVTIENPRSRREMVYNKDFTYHVAVKVAKTTCDSCPGGVSCDIVSCQIVDGFKGPKQTDLRKIEKFTKNAIERNWAAAGFKVVKLFGSANTAVDTTFEYCVDLVAGNCDNCIDTDFLFTTFSFTEPDGETPTEFTFTNVANAGGTATLASQLRRVVDQINVALDGHGHAVLTKSIGKCCSYKIEVNTCYADFVITGLTPCATSNPFEFTYVPTTVCKNCTTTAAIAPPTCGFRIIADTVDYDCGKYPETSPIVNFLQEINVYTVSGFDGTNTYVRDIQVGSNPKNLGYHWQFIDINSDNGGLGRTHNEYNDQYGSLGLPGSRDRVNSTNIKCPTQYCSYSIHHNLPFHTQDVFGEKRYVQGLTSVIIPSADTTTRTGFEAIINPYISSLPHQKIATVTCGSDQDVASDAFPDYNGNRDI